MKKKNPIQLTELRLGSLEQLSDDFKHWDLVFFSSFDFFVLLLYVILGKTMTVYIPLLL